MKGEGANYLKLYFCEITILTSVTTIYPWTDIVTQSGRHYINKNTNLLKIASIKINIIIVFR